MSTGAGTQDASRGAPWAASSFRRALFTFVLGFGALLGIALLLAWAAAGQQ